MKRKWLGVLVGLTGLLLMVRGAQAQEELQPKVEVTLGPGTVVFIAAILHGETSDDQEMLPVHYDARFDKVKVECPEGENPPGGCTEIRLGSIGFPRTYSTDKAPCETPRIQEVTFGHRLLAPGDPPRRSRKKGKTAWFQAGLSVQNGATILAAYRCPESPESDPPPEPETSP